MGSPLLGLVPSRHRQPSFGTVGHFHSLRLLSRSPFDREPMAGSKIIGALAMVGDVQPFAFAVRINS